MQFRDYVIGIAAAIEGAGQPCVCPYRSPSMVSGLLVIAQWRIGQDKERRAGHAT